MKATEHAVADGDTVDVGPRRQHRADELVPDREPGLDRHPPVVDVQIRPTDPTRLDRDHAVVSRNQLRLRLLLDPNFPRPLKRDNPHGPTV